MGKQTKIKRGFKVNPVIVDWIDSSQISGWHFQSDIEPPDLRCSSIGHLIDKNDKTVTLALNINGDCYGQMITIPMFAVKRIRKLRE